MSCCKAADKLKELHDRIEQVRNALHCLDDAGLRGSELAVAMQGLLVDLERTVSG